MPEHSLRFGVTNGKGLRSATWKCWTISGTGKRDVYLLCRDVGNAIKLSMHETGRWHVGFASRDLFDEANLPASRYLGAWEKPSPIVGPYILASRIHVPQNAVSTQDNDLESGIHWTAFPPDGKAVEFAIFLTERPHYGRPVVELIRERASLIGTLPLEGGGAVHLVSYLREKIDMGPSRSGKIGYFKGAGRDEVLKGNRAVVWDATADGSIMFVETPVTVALD
jgi:hypothetical protein